MPFVVERQRTQSALLNSSQSFIGSNHIPDVGWGPSIVLYVVQLANVVVPLGYLSCNLMYNPIVKDDKETTRFMALEWSCLGL
jgi:hypothetical protein